MMISFQHDVNVSSYDAGGRGGVILIWMRYFAVCRMYIEIAVLVNMLGG